MDTPKKKLVPVHAVNEAITALQVSYGYVFAHLKTQGRSTAGDSTLQQLSAAINGLGGSTPALHTPTDQYPCRLHDGCTSQCGDPHLYCTGFCSH